MSKMKVLQIGLQSDRFNHRLETEYDVSKLWLEADQSSWLARYGTGIEAIATSAQFGCRSDMIKALPDLKVICSFGVGYESIDVDTAHRRSIPVSNTPDVLNDCVADLAFSLVLDVSRRVAEADRFVRAGDWSSKAFPLGRSVHHKKLGIIGLGRVGKAVARRARGFEMEIGYHNRRPNASVDYHYVASVLELAQWADFLVLTCVGGPSTNGLVSRAALEALGPQGVLINVSRGSVVDEDALVQALVDGKLGGAGLDVFRNEPAVPETLKTLPNVVLLPHLGSATGETRRAMEDLVFDNLHSFQKHGKLLTPITRLS
jgi:hydroxypyruvate reductase